MMRIMLAMLRKSMCEKSAMFLQVLIFVFTCCGGSPTIIPKPWGAVLPKDELPSVARPCSRSFPDGLTGYWVPSREVLNPLEDELVLLIPRMLPPKKGGTIARVPSEYRLQYMGFYRQERKVVYVSAFPSYVLEMFPNASDWTQGYVRVCDAGADAFGLVYDIQSRHIDTLDIDGEMDVGPRIDISKLQQ